MRIFSGMRPSGQLHIGNYLGALKNWLGLQKKHQCIFAVVDYHAITTPLNPKQIPILTNLEPKTIKGIESKGMILAIDIDNKATLLHPDKQVPNGSKVR